MLLSLLLCWNSCLFWHLFNAHNYIWYSNGNINVSVLNLKWNWNGSTFLWPQKIRFPAVKHSTFGKLSIKLIFANNKFQTLYAIWLICKWLSGMIVVIYSFGGIIIHFWLVFSFFFEFYRKNSDKVWKSAARFINLSKWALNAAIFFVLNHCFSSL